MTKPNSFPTPQAIALINESHSRRLIYDRYSKEFRTIRQAITHLRRYLATLEQMIQAAEQAEVEELEKQYPPESNEEFWAYIYPDHWQGVVLRHFRASFVISALSIFEHYLKQICRDSQFVKQHEPSYESAKPGSTVARARQYLSAEIGFTQPNELVWIELQNMYEIRNALVHALDDVYAFRRFEKLVGLIEKYPGLEIMVKNEQWQLQLDGTAQYVLVIKPEFCGLLIDTVATCLYDLCSEMIRLCENTKASVR